MRHIEISILRGVMMSFTEKFELPPQRLVTNDRTVLEEVIISGVVEYITVDCETTNGRKINIKKPAETVVIFDEVNGSKLQDLVTPDVYEFLELYALNECELGD